MSGTGLLSHVIERGAGAGSCRKSELTRGLATLPVSWPPRRRAGVGGLQLSKQVPGAGQQLAGDRDGGDLLPAALRHCRVSFPELGTSHPERPATGLSWKGPGPHRVMRVRLSGETPMAAPGGDLKEWQPGGFADARPIAPCCSPVLMTVCHTASVGKAKRIRAKRSSVEKRKSPITPPGASADPIKIELPRPKVTAFREIIVVPSFSSDHPLDGTDLPPSGSPGKYIAQAAFGTPGISQSVFTDLDWDEISAKGDSLIRVSENVARLTLKWRHGGQEVISYEFGINAAGRLATAQTSLDARSFREALTIAQNALDSYLSSLSFYHDVPVEAVAWRVVEERTGAVHFAMKMLGRTKELDIPPTLLRSTPSRRELLSTWREAMNAPTPMFQALGYYKIIERIHKYRIEREVRARNTEKPYWPPRELIPDKPEKLSTFYEGQPRSLCRI